MVFCLSQELWCAAYIDWKKVEIPRKGFQARYNFGLLV